MLSIMLFSVNRNIPDWLQLEYISKSLKQNLLLVRRSDDPCGDKLAEATFGDEAVRVALYRRKD